MAKRMKTRTVSKGIVAH